MIEINLVPDVKQELIRAQRLRSLVISGSIIVTLTAVGLVVLLSLYVFGAQTVRGNLADSAIEENFGELSQEDGLSNMVTIQNQLTRITQTHNQKLVSSRTLDVLTAIVPEEPNTVAISRVALDEEEGTITIDAQAANGYLAYEVFKKTILSTNLVLSKDGEQTTEPLASNFVEGDRSYGDDAEGVKVLRFSVSFDYNETLYDREAGQLSIQGPNRTNATDSNVAVPDSLFTTRATDSEEDQ